MDCEFKTLPMSEDQLLAWAEGRDGGYELVEGAVMMQAEATRDHERVAKRIFALLYGRVDEARFDVNKGDFGVRIRPGEGKGSIPYPDMVVDPQSGSGEERATLTPIVVIEVLSASSDLTITSKNSHVTPSGRRRATTPSSTRNSHGLFSGRGRRQAGRTSPSISTGQGRSSRLSTPACRWARSIGRRRAKIRYHRASRHRLTLTPMFRARLDDLLTSEPGTMGGRRVFRGTRVPVEVLFENLADGLSLDEILDSYESLNRDDVVAVLELMSRSLTDPKAA